MRVLVAEDSQTIRTVLERLLIKMGHEVVTCASGQEVLALIDRQQLPQLLILDWMMPDGDGLEVCRKLRATPNLPYMHIMMLTARNQSDDVVAGLRAGINDYVTKPVNATEFQTRLDVAVQLIELNNLVNRQRLEMIQTYKLVGMGQIAESVGQEISLPLLTIRQEIESLSQKVSDHDWQGISISRTQMADAMKDIGRIVRSLGIMMSKPPESFNSSLHANQLLQNLFDYCHDRANRAGIDLHLTIDSDNPTISGRWVELFHALLNLVENSMQAVANQRERWIELSVTSDRKWIQIAVADSGPGIPLAIQRAIMEPFVTSKPDGVGNGLGLTIARQTILSHQGTMAIDANSPSTRIQISLPREFSSSSAQKSRNPAAA